MHGQTNIKSHENSWTNINFPILFKPRMVIAFPFSIWKLQKLEYRPSNVFCILIDMTIVPVKFTSWNDILNFLQVPLKKQLYIVIMQRLYETPRDLTFI